MDGSTFLEPKVADQQSLEEHKARGKAQRAHTPRARHALWAPDPDRPDPIDLLKENSRSRVTDLVPIRYGRMSLSPFAFLRGSAVIMACDLAKTPDSGIKTQICGDAHLLNFGIYATPERQQVFDVNDFDETLPGPWEWDIKRLATSIVVAGRHNKFSAQDNKEAVLQCVHAYQTHMQKLSNLGYTEIWYSTIDSQKMVQFVHNHSNLNLNRTLTEAHQQTNARIFPRFTQCVNGNYEMKEQPPLMTHLHEDDMRQQLHKLLESYRASLQDDRRALLNHYQVEDIVHKVVGVGSVGTRCYVALLMGKNQYDPLFLQIKEAQTSVLEPYLGSSHYKNSAQRVVAGQRLMQAASDLFLGWTHLGNSYFYLRQFHNRTSSPNVENMHVQGFSAYGRLCGFALARAHGRAGDAAQISGYLGSNDVFAQAIATFAERYADQVEQDHAALLAAIKSGKITAEVGV